MQHVVFFVKILAARLIPDQSRTTQLQLDRQAYLVDKHFKFVPDEIVSSQRFTKNPIFTKTGSTPTAANVPDIEILPNVEQAQRVSQAADAQSLQTAGVRTTGHTNAVLTKKQRQEMALVATSAIEGAAQL